jgi:AI-2 transport protein TqsA
MTSEKSSPAAPHSSAASRILISLAAFVVVIAGLKAAVSIVVPFLMAVFLAVIATPALFWLQKKGISTIFAILIISLTILIIGILVGTLVGTSIAGFTRSMPAYETKLQGWINSMADPNDFMGRLLTGSPEPDSSASVQPDAPSGQSDLRAKLQSQVRHFLVEGRQSLRKYIHAGQILSVIRDLLSQLGSILANGVLIYLTMVFILLEASILPAKIQAALKNSPETYKNLAIAADNVKRYLALKTMISLVTGILVTIWLLILKVDYAFLWGLIAFLFNFIPSIGSIIAAVPAVIMALLQHGPGTALLTILGYVVANVVFESFVQPRLMGQQMGLSTLVVFLSLIFWSWVLGPVGMLLSIPLTMLVKIVLQSREETRWAAILLGSENPSPPKKKKTKAG